MAAVTAAMVKELREMTGAGMMDCKKALAATEGDMDKAVDFLREKGLAGAQKKAGRIAAEGIVATVVSADGKSAVAVEVNAETDFVAKNAEFIELTQNILNTAMDKKPANKEELLALPLADGRTIANHITDRIGVTGEKMELGAYEYISGASSISYIHPGNKLATVAAFNEAIEHQMARDIAMQIAAMNPVAVLPEQVGQHIIDQELQIAREKALEAGKPENLLDRIAQGALQKYYKENTLLQQEFVKDSKLTIEQYLHTGSKTLTVVGFKRFTLNAD